MQIPFLDLKKINASFEPQLSEALKKVIDSGYYIMGSEVEKFNQELANYCGVKYAVGVANGLDALIVILEAYKLLGKLKIGDEVIVPANTYIASIIAIEKAGLVPVLAEPCEATFNLSVSEVSKLLTNQTKVIMAVHLYGQLADVENLKSLAKEKKLLFIEDAAQSHGAVKNGIKAGAWGDAAAFSFYPGKNLGALGDGGAVTTNDEILAKTVATYANYGSEKKYFNLYSGINSRLDSIQAAVLSVKLKRLDEDNEKRRQIAEMYSNKIKNDSIILPKMPKDRLNHVWHLYVVKTTKRKEFQDFLSEKGISTLIHYPVPPHKQMAFAKWNGLSLPLTEKIHEQVLSLPISPVMTEEEVNYVINCVNSFE